jgi:hypothetical protein
MSNARKDSVALCLETMRDADIARAFVLACADDRLRKAVRRKAATGLDYGQLEAFIRTEDDTLKASKPGQSSSSSNHKRSQKPASASSARARGAVAAAAEAASASQDDDASDADEPTSNDLNDDQVEALIEAVRSRFPSNRRRPRRGFRPRQRSPAPQQSTQQPRDSSGRFASSYASAANSAKPMTSASSIAGCTFCSSDDHTNASCPTFTRPSMPSPPLATLIPTPPPPPLTLSPLILLCLCRETSGRGVALDAAPPPLFSHLFRRFSA